RVVWEWYLEDHLIQDYDSLKGNFGAPEAHPELLDFNMGRPIPPALTQDSLDILVAKGWADRNETTGSRGADIYHFNAVNYNAVLDQIVISSPHLDELLIIDHSTTTQEAAGHKGGKSGKGGDFLYRWGNPKNYQRGDTSNQQFWGQHDVRWIEDGKPGAGHLIVFNNNVPGRKDSLDYSVVLELTLPVDEAGHYQIENGKPFGPEKPNWMYVASDTISFHSGFISGAHRMNNGNTFINEGARGRFFEVTPEGKIVWEYLNPYHGEIRKPNGDPTDIMPMAYSQFRATFIPSNHPALVGKELKPIDPQPKPFVLPPPSKEDKKM
ncbi:MAG: aryl-sulfate sulfotransferase, partial [Bacteroidia bacterium]|nr:aryl-sulfate sulfotransferase [Bacteroidia bacterium]